MTTTTGRVVGVEGGEKLVHWEGDYPPVGTRVFARVAFGNEILPMARDHGHDGPCEAVGCDADLPAYLDYLEGQPTRERCLMCQRISSVGFHVPDEVWRACVHPSRQNDVLCLCCFISMADEKLVPWDKHIAFYPVSLRSHLENT